MIFVFRRGTHSDVENIHNAMIEVHDSVPDKAWFDIKYTTVEWLHEDVNGDGFILLAEDENRNIAGFLVARYPSKSEDNIGNHIHSVSVDAMTVLYITDVAVIPAYRGHGLMRMLLDKAKDLACDNIKYLAATVHPDNIASLHVFTECGYSMVDVAYCGDFGIWVNILLKDII